MGRTYQRHAKRKDLKGTPWWIDFTWRGQRYREPGGKTEHEASEKLRQREVEVREGKVIPAHQREGLTIEKLAALWLASPMALRKVTRGKGGVDVFARHDRRRLGIIAEVLGKGRQVDSLKRADIDGPEGLINALKQRKVRAKRGSKKDVFTSDAEVNRHLAVLKSALRYAKAMGFDHRDPMAGVKPFKEPSRLKVASEKDLAAIAKHADPELRLAVVLAVETACRRTELIALDWAQVDLDGASFRLRSGDTKGRQERLVILSEDAVAALKALPHREGRVFASTPDSISHRFRAACTKAKISDLRLHDLRRTAATNMRRAGVDLLTIQKQTGHKSLEMLRRYEAIDLDDVRDAVRKTSAKRKQLQAAPVESEGEAAKPGTERAKKK